MALVFLSCTYVLRKPNRGLFPNLISDLRKNKRNLNECKSSGEGGNWHSVNFRVIRGGPHQHHHDYHHQI